MSATLKGVRSKLSFNPKGKQLYEGMNVDKHEYQQASA